MYGMSGLGLCLFVALLLGLLWEAPTIVRERQGRIMHDMRKLMGCLFGIMAVADLCLAPVVIPNIVHWGSVGFLVREVCFIAVLLLPAVIYGVAGWVVLKERPSANIWAIVASPVCFLSSLCLVFNSWRLASWCTWVMAAFGVTGLVIFLWREEGEEIRPSTRR